MELPGVVLDNLLKQLGDFNDIKYAAYRTSAKIRILQQAFFLDKLPVEVLGGVLLQHHLTCTENTVTLTPSELSSLLEDIYFIVSREHKSDINIQQSVNILCRFLLQVLHKEGGMELLAVKVVLSVLCGSKPRDKYNYLFSQLSDHNNVLTSRRLELLLQRLVLLTGFIGESRTFGRTLVPGTVKSCFQVVPAGSLGVTLEDFSAWLSRDPQLLVWISTLHRLHLAHSVVHDVKCSACKLAPITGLRYRCLRCLTYNQCQQCFFHGKTSRNHKLNHPVQEYCYPSTAKQSLRAILATIHNKMRRSGWKLQYLPAEQRESYLEEPTLQFEETMRTLNRSSMLPLGELENIIIELEEQSNRLLQTVDGLQSSKVKNELINHRDLVEKQVERLKVIKKLLVRQKRNRGMAESTPCTRPGRRVDVANYMSPIPSDSLALTWDKYGDIGGPEEGSCILKWDEESGSSSSDTVIQPVSSHAYTWLQSTAPTWQPINQETYNKPSEEETQESDKDIQSLHDDLDVILQRLQDLLSNTQSVATENQETPNIVPTTFIEHL